MTLNETPSAGRTHIVFFGRRNAGKSGLMMPRQTSKQQAKKTTQKVNS